MSRKKANKTPKRVRTRQRPVARPSPAALGGLRETGVMRLALVLLTVILLVSAPRPGTPAVLAGWQMWPTLIVPTLAPILFMVLMLDALMARVMMTSVQGAMRDRYRRIVVLELVQGAVLVLYWLPYYIVLARG